MDEFDKALEERGVANEVESSNSQSTPLPEAPIEQEKLYAGKFKSPEALEKSYTELEKLLGTLGNEVGELRKAVQYYQSQEEEEEQFDDLYDEDPRQAVMKALQSNDYNLYMQAMENWIEESPFEAMNFHTQRMLEQERNNIISSIIPSIAPIREQYESEQLAGVMKALIPIYQDLPNYLDDMLNIANSRPQLLANIGSPDSAVKTQAIEDLYFLAKARRNPVNPPYVESGNTRLPETNAANDNIAAFKTWLVNSDNRGY